jgi:hypothetical protein
MWVTTLPNGQQFFLLFTGNQYQIWDNSQMMDSGTIQLQGDAMTQQSASGKTDVHTVQFNPNGNSFSIVATNGQAGATTYQRVQQGQGVPPQQPPVQTPPVQYPQQPPTEQPPVQFPTQPPVQQPPVQLPPQPGNPPQQQQISMDGRWNGVDREGLPVLMIISGNTFQIWYVNANRLFLSGTFQIQGTYANFNGEILNGFQVSPDGNSFSYNANGGFVMTYHRER